MTERPLHTDPPAARGVRPLVAATVVLLLGAALVLGGIFSGVRNERAASDQSDYHLLVIQQFSRQLPRPDLSDYRSATGPGYHLPLAAVHRWVIDDVRVLRVAGALFTLALLATLGWAVGRTARWPTAVALCLPTATSLYVFGSGVWLLPDNLAWLTVLASLILAYRGSSGPAAVLTASAVLAAAVSVRQINLWPLGVLVAGAMMDPAARAEERLGLMPPLRQTGGVRRAGWMLLAGVPALLILAWFYRLWGGLTPPAFQKVDGPLPPGHSGWQHEGPNFAVPTMVLSVLAATGVFFTGYVWPTVRQLFAGRGRGRALVGLGVLAGAAAALVVPTNFDVNAGRYSGLWNVSARLPSVGQHSLLMMALAATGGGLVVLWFLALGRRDRWIWLSAWACFIAAQTANAMAWHKYYEPFCLMMLALATARVAPLRGSPRWSAAGPVLLAVLLAGVTLSTLTRG